MKTYKVGIYEEQGGYVYIQAKNQKDADEKVKSMVDEVGIEELKNDYCQDIDEIDITYRAVNFI